VTGWAPPGRSREARAIFTAAEADRVANPHRYQLDPDELAERALGDAAADELGDDDWREGLAVFLESAREDARLNAVGLRMAAGAAIGRLRARLATRRWLAEHPERAAARPRSPVFIVGSWRTGTTLLQRMLAAASPLRALHPWELSAPWKAAGATGELRAKLVAGAQVAHDHLHLLNSRLQQVHDSGASLPEECVLAMGTHFRNWGFLSTMRLERYARWLAQQDLSAEYAAYADVLAMLDERDGRRFVLKAPAHTAELPHLLDTFPDAVIVHLHRDVVETVASSASLFAVFRSTYSDEVDPVDVGAFVAWQTRLWLERAMVFRDACTTEGRGRFVDVAYPDLVRDPIAIARTILEASDLSWNDDIETALRSYVNTHAQHRHGRHRYTPEDFGLDPDALRVELSAYRQRFGIG